MTKNEAIEILTPFYNIEYDKRYIYVRNKTANSIGCHKLTISWLETVADRSVKILVNRAKRNKNDRP